MILNGIIWYYMVLYDIIWNYMILFDIIWYCMILFDIIWYCMILFDIIWYYRILYYVIKWYYMILHDIIWYYMILFDILWYYMILYYYIISYDIIWYYMMFYDTILLYQIIWYYMILYVWWLIWMLMSTRHITTVLMKTSAIQKTRDHSNPRMWLFGIQHRPFPPRISDALPISGLCRACCALHNACATPSAAGAAVGIWFQPKMVRGVGTGRHQKMDENGGFFKFTGVPNCQKSDLADKGKVFFFLEGHKFSRQVTGTICPVDCMPSQPTLDQNPSCYHRLS